MKSNIFENRHIIECSCSDPGHIFVIDYDKDFDFIEMGFIYNRYLSFWGRIKAALKFILLKNDLYYQSILIYDEHIKQIEDLIDDIKNERFAILKD